MTWKWTRKWKKPNTLIVTLCLCCVVFSHEGARAGMPHVKYGWFRGVPEKRCHFPYKWIKWKHSHKKKQLHPGVNFYPTWQQSVKPCFNDLNRVNWRQMFHMMKVDPQFLCECHPPFCTFLYYTIRTKFQSSTCVLINSCGAILDRTVWLYWYINWIHMIGFGH